MLEMPKTGETEEKLKKKKKLIEHPIAVVVAATMATICKIIFFFILFCWFLRIVYKYVSDERRKQRTSSVQHTNKKLLVKTDVQKEKILILLNDKWNEGERQTGKNEYFSGRQEKEVERWKDCFTTWIYIRLAYSRLYWFSRLLVSKSPAR